MIIRDLSGMAEFRQAEALQYAVWGKDDMADPADLMMVIQAEGGLAAGAFQGDRLIGYVFAFPTRTPHIQHSHRLAVLAQARGTGLGAALKWYQRDWCLARDITHVRWTYDPLRAANARLNIGVLGAQVTTYYPDYYGAMEGINKGTPSDRLLADWHLNAPPVVARSKGGRSRPEGLRIAIPKDFAALMINDPELAQSERLRLRDALTQQLDKGLAIIGFDPDENSYIMSPD
jgi:predicted GNAT superfamily acetyltransferase